jgi:hypothetical protein
MRALLESHCSAPLLRLLSSRIGGSTWLWSRALPHYHNSTCSHEHSRTNTHTHTHTHTHSSFLHAYSLHQVAFHNQQVTGALHSDSALQPNQQKCVCHRQVRRPRQIGPPRCRQGRWEQWCQCGTRAPLTQDETTCMVMVTGRAFQTLQCSE